MRADWRAICEGREVAVLCSGPSMCAEDATAVAHLPRIVTNTTFRLALDADFLFGFDAAWWARHAIELDAVGCRSRRVSYHTQARKHGCVPMDQAPEFRGFGNSGAAAVALAAALGARRVLLLGADCKVGTKTHWHGDHPPGLSNARSVRAWPRQFELAGRYARARRTEVINCSRETALTCFPRAELLEALCEVA